MSGFDFLAVFIFIWVILAGLAAIETKDRFTSVIMLSLVGLGATFLFAMMNAPDVAITEGVIGSGLTSAIFLMTLKRLKTKEGEENE